MLFLTQTNTFKALKADKGHDELTLNSLKKQKLLC